MSDSPQSEKHKRILVPLLYSSSTQSSSVVLDLYVSSLLCAQQQSTFKPIVSYHGHQKWTDSTIVDIQPEVTIYATVVAGSISPMLKRNQKVRTP